jgi:hypothetical protein
LQLRCRGAHMTRERSDTDPGGQLAPTSSGLGDVEQCSTAYAAKQVEE